jgi:hypothetical protein
MVAIAARVNQYVARPPDTSKMAPVLKLISSLARLRVDILPAMTTTQKSHAMPGIHEGSDS